MKITKVDVKNWRILNKPKAAFGALCVVIIGENGSGKSTLIELILTVFDLVFKRLRGYNHPSWVDGFYLEYDINGHQVVFESGYLEGSKPEELHISIDGTAYSIKEDGGELLRDLMPANIIAYYAGDTQRVMSVCDFFLRENVDAVRKSGNEFTLAPLMLPEVTPFIYSDIKHIGVALMSLIVTRQRSHTLDKLDIREEATTAVVTLKKPHWAAKDSTSEDLWGNTSTLFNDFISGLIENSFGRTTDENHIIIEINLMNLRDYLDSLNIGHKGVFLFQMFDLLNNNDLLKSVDVRWIRNGEEFNAPPISIEYFSEGEKQVIMTSALTEFWDKEHCLFLLDEPDTFLHPKWQSRFLPEVQENLRDSQAIITTHSSLMLSSVGNNCELFTMKEGKLMVIPFSTYGMEAGEVIETVMESVPRDIHVGNLLEDIDDDLDNMNIKEAQQKLELLEDTGVSRYEINRIQTTIEQLEKHN